MHSNSSTRHTNYSWFLAHPSDNSDPSAEAFRLTYKAYYKLGVEKKPREAIALNITSLEIVSMAFVRDRDSVGEKKLSEEDKDNIKNIEGKASQGIAIAYTEIGSGASALEEREKSFHQAIEHYKRAQDIYEQRFGNENTEYIYVDLDLATVESMTGELDKAQERLEKIITFMKCKRKHQKHQSFALATFIWEKCTTNKLL